MGGFDRDRVAALLVGDGTLTPLAVVAVGRRVDAGQLDESLAAPERATPERATRQRLPITDLLLSVRPVSVPTVAERDGRG
ncbi:hypothetical protein [Micromonospora sp. LOL_023]|uniref:hypothetical protein n=1 Tax=Micromonospora sp. LOL_023 TaxID=3345418 RepID=UPI003A889581